MEREKGGCFVRAKREPKGGTVGGCGGSGSGL
jgi:hypothetical protein